MTAPILAWSRNAAITYVLTLVVLGILMLVFQSGDWRGVGDVAAAAAFQIFVFGTALLPLEAAILYATYVRASTEWELAAAARGRAKPPTGGGAAAVPSPPGVVPPYFTCPTCGERVGFGVPRCPACQRDILWS